MSFINTSSPPQVEVLFRSHNDLLSEFAYFLPDAQAVKEQRRVATGGFRGGRGGHPGGRNQQVWNREVLLKVVLTHVPHFASGIVITSRALIVSSQVSSPAVKHKRKTAQRAEEGFKAGCESLNVPGRDGMEEWTVR